MSSPPTPTHPGPNEEVRDLPSGMLPPADLEDIDLNPDLYSDDDDEAPGGASDISERDGYQVTVPFDSAYQHLQSTFAAQPASQMSRDQESKLVNYMDDTLLKIQRQFVRNQAEEHEIYSLQQLVVDLKKAIDVLFVSIATKSPLFGQPEYYIKMMSDLEDYVAHYRDIFEVNLVAPVLSLLNHTKLITFLTLIQTLDVHLSLLIDGYDAGGRRDKLSATGVVRLMPIVSRLRILIISKLEPVRLRLLQVVRGSTSEQVQREALATLNLLDVETGRIFEGILDRS